MKKDKLITYFLLILLIIVLLFALFVPNIINKRIIAVFLLIYTIVVAKKIKKRNTDSIKSREVIILMCAFAVIYLIGFYLMGLYFGFYASPVKFGIWALDKYIFPFLIIIICSEITRNIFLAQNKVKYSQTLIFIVTVLIDLILYTGVYNLSNLNDLLTVIGYILFASISCNLLYNYISNRFGIYPIIIYRIITIIYAYIIPFVPGIYVFLKSFFRMIYPYFIYLLLEALYAKPNISVVAYVNKKRRIITSIILFSIMVILIMLISCQFKYGAIVIGSGSMTGAIDKGDVVIFEQYDDQTIKEGQIIVYNRDGMRIIHRVVKIKNINGAKVYVTKGDMNSTEDTPYITDNDIVGVYLFRLRSIGYPSLFIRELFY